MGMLILKIQDNIGSYISVQSKIFYFGIASEETLMQDLKYIQMKCYKYEFVVFFLQQDPYLMYVICVCLRILSCVSALCFTYCVLCTIYCQFLWIVHFWLPRLYSLTFIKAYKNDPHINTYSRQRCCRPKNPKMFLDFVA